VRDIIWVTENATLDQALQLLSDNNLLSLPVLSQDKTTAIGVIDVVDIAAFIASHMSDITPISAQTLTEIELDGENLMDSTLVKNILGGNASSRIFSAVKISDSVEKLVDTLSRGNRRVPILNEENRIINFVSQTDVVRYFAENIQLLGERGSTNLSQFGIETSRVAYVKYDMSVISALKFMVSQRLSALAVVGDTGQLVANFSASNLKGLSRKDFPLLLQPVSTFLLNYHPKSLHPRTCLPSDTLEYVILKLVACRVHRLWCVDPNFKLVGVVSNTDIMRFFLGVGPMTS